ncbi:hypothetical protein HZB00_01310 [Candidatus Woesearchaeota archaeon]|nr:hypothetical protein [Candidatus Woesearchaeota archaeon]
MQDLIKFPQGISLVYGEPGSGKTTFCLIETVRQLQKNKKVIFFSTAGSFSLERLLQLDQGINTEKLFVLEIESFNRQHQQIKALTPIKNVSLIILDSGTMFYRRLFTREPELAQGMLSKQLQKLKEIAEKNKIPIIVTSQVYEKNKEIFSIAQEIFKKYAVAIFKLQRDPRAVIIEKPVRQRINFILEEKGIKIV